MAENKNLADVFLEAAITFKEHPSAPTIAKNIRRNGEPNYLHITSTFSDLRSGYRPPYRRIPKKHENYRR